MRERQGACPAHCERVSESQDPATLGSSGAGPQPAVAGGGSRVTRGRACLAAIATQRVLHTLVPACVGPQNDVAGGGRHFARATRECACLAAIATRFRRDASSASRACPLQGMSPRQAWSLHQPAEVSAVTSASRSQRGEHAAVRATRLAPPVNAGHVAG